VLPYSPSSALALCTLHDQVTGSLSPLCTRTLLQRVINTALGKLGISFSVGAELEFVLAREGVNFEPVDHSVFANMVTLDEQESFILTLYQWLDMLDIQVTQIHAESAPGQLEVVLAHQDDALRIADHIVLAKEVRDIWNALHYSFCLHIIYYGFIHVALFS
jgi:glutamine synthetase